MWIGTNVLDKVAEWLGIAEWSDYCQGFFFGMILVLVVSLLVRLLWPLVTGRRKFKGVVVAGSAGNLYITINAIRQFIHRILTEFEEVSLSSVTVRETRGQIVFSIDLEVVPDVDLVPLRDQIQGRVMEDAEKRLGLGLPIKVNLDIRSIQANARRLSRTERKRREQARAEAQAANEQNQFDPEPETAWETDRPEETAEPENRE